MTKDKKETHLITTGVVVSVLGNSSFRVKCENGSVVVSRISSEFRSKKKRGVSSKIIEGSTLEIKLSLNDLSLGSIIGFCKKRY